MMTKNELYNLNIMPPNAKIYSSVMSRFDSLCKPIGGFGDFEDIIARIGAIQGLVMPDIKHRALIIACADNGVVEEGISQTDSAVSSMVASLMGKRKSTVGIMTEKAGIDIIVYDIGLKDDEKIKGIIDKKIARGTKNIKKEAAMTEEECLKAVETGILAVKENKDKYGIIATGEMGIGNTTTSAALLCALTGADPVNVTGRGAGLDDERLSKKIKVIKESTERAKIVFNESAFFYLKELGGFDIAMLAGIFIGGAIYGVPIIADGLISVVAALAADRMVPGVKDFVIASHAGKEKGMNNALKELSLKPVIHANMALGEGTGAVMMFPLLDMVYEFYENGLLFSDTEIEAYERQNG